MGLKNFTDNKVGKSIVLKTYFCTVRKNPRDNHSFQGPKRTSSSYSPIRLFRNEKGTGPSQLFRKSLWECYLGQGKNWPIADRLP